MGRRKHHPARARPLPELSSLARDMCQRQGLQQPCPKPAL